MTLARGEREWALLVSEYNICKKKLESKRQALKILVGDLESCQRERDIYKNKIRQMQQEIDNYKKKEQEHDSKDVKRIRSPTSQTARSPEHVKFKRERKLSAQTIWEQELQSVRDRKNKTLSQLLCEARQENKALKNDFMDLRVLYREAQEDIILLRENVARQSASERDTGKMGDLEARQDLIQHLEKNQEQVEVLEREVQAVADEKSEINIERDHYRDKVERLNTQLNFILGADDRRLVDIDAILMENRYQKEQIKQLKEEHKIANAALARHKAAFEKKKARLIKAGYNPGAFMGTGVKQALPSLISEISNSFGGGVSSSTVNDLQSLANSLSESLSEKDIALLHQKNTNRILGTRVTELENKLKTLEVSGLWSLEGHRGYGSDEMIKLYLEKVKRSPGCLKAETENAPAIDEIPSAESSPDMENGDSVFFLDGGDNHDQLLHMNSLVSVSEGEDEEDIAVHCGNNNALCHDDSGHCSITACRSGEPSSTEGDSLAYSRENSPARLKGDSPIHSLVESPACSEEDSTRSIGDFPACSNGDSPTCSKGHSPTRSIGDSPTRSNRDSPACSKEDSLTRSNGDSPEESSSLEDDYEHWKIPVYQSIAKEIPNAFDSNGPDHAQGTPKGDDEIENETDDKNAGRKSLDLHENHTEEIQDMKLSTPDNSLKQCIQSIKSSLLGDEAVFSDQEEAEMDEFAIETEAKHKEKPNEILNVSE